MLSMTARRWFGIEVDDGTDEVMFGISLPSETIVDDVRVKLDFISGSVAGGGNQFPIITAGAIAVEGYVLPVFDPDTSTPNFDVLWDQLVPKDTDVDVIDLDTVAQDATSFFEPGEMAMANIFDIGNQPKRIFHHHRLVTAVNSSVHTLQAIATPADPGKYTPGGSLQIHLNKPMRVSQPSVLVFAFGVPFMTDTSASGPGALGEAEWAQVKYMEHTLERAMLHQLGVFEAGAETPWEEASALLRKHLNPDILENVANQFHTQGEYAVFGEASIRHRVVGELKIGNISTGR